MTQSSGLAARTPLPPHQPRHALVHVLPVSLPGANKVGFSASFPFHQASLAPAPEEGSPSLTMSLGSPGRWGAGGAGRSSHSTQ